MTSRVRAAAAVAGVFVCAVVVTGTTRGAIPEEITYQGRLLTLNNGPINACLDMTFRFYDGPGQGAALLWTEPHTGGNCVDVTDSEFSVDLGSLVTFDSAGLTFQIRYFLGIQVGNDTEMVPRRRFNSVGYSIRSIDADAADYSDDSDHAVDSDQADLAVDSNNADRSDFAVGVKEGGVAQVMLALRNGDTPQAGSAIYTDPVSAMADLATWCGTPSASAPCLLEIKPGRYDIGAGDLTMSPWVDIEGSGIDATAIVTTGSIQLAANSQIRSLRIEKTGGGNPALVVNGAPVRVSRIEIQVAGGVTGILNSGSTPVIDNVTITGCAMPAIKNDGGEATITSTTIRTSCSGSNVGIENNGGADAVLANDRIEVSTTTSDPAIGLYNVSAGTVAATNLVIEASSDSGPASGIENDGSLLQLSGSVVRATAPSALGIGIDNPNGGTIEVDQSVLSGDDFSVRSPSGTARIGSTKLDGMAGGASTHYACVGVYDESYAPLQGDCKP